MLRLLLVVTNLILFGCVSSKKVQQVSSFGKGFDFLKVTDTFQLSVTEFYKNNTYPYSEGGAPYALLIGNPNSTKLPKIISVLAIRDNSVYEVGEIVTIVPKKNIIEETSSGLMYFTKDTIINTVKSRLIIGAENPAVLAKVVK